MGNFTNIQELVQKLAPEIPLYVHRPESIYQAAKFFLDNFKGTTLYAVKTNPDQAVLRQIYDIGITSFDVASLEEVSSLYDILPDARLYFMHPIKSRIAIRKAYYDYKVRDFVLDSFAELDKITSEIGDVDDLNLFIRIAVPNNYSGLKLADKFGIDIESAPSLLRKTREYCRKLGISFHVGSQCMSPDAYRHAINMASEVAKLSGMKIDILDVGGGFPSIYPGMIPTALQNYFSVIDEAFANSPLAGNCQLICEPGRAIVAESGSIIVKIEHRRGSYLYLNDGTYGNLFDAGAPNFIFPTRLIRIGDLPPGNLTPFSFYGPTCDSLDFMKGPFLLPDDAKEGDYIEIGQLGAYSKIMSTQFNGFGKMAGSVTTNEKPLMTMY